MTRLIATTILLLIPSLLVAALMVAAFLFGRSGCLGLCR